MTRLNPLTGVHRQGSDHVAGMFGGGGFHEHEPDFFAVLGTWAVLHAFGHHVAFAGVEFDRFSIAKIQEEGSLVDEEKFVFVGVIVPDEFPLHLREFQLLAVQFSNYFG